MKAKKTLLMETTAISAERSAGEITSALVSAGAMQIATDYEAGQITGLRWMMRINGVDRTFAMPARVEPVYKILLSRRHDSGSSATQAKIREQAIRVAWRQLLRWVQAQIAMIDCGMTEPAEVFFAYIQHSSGESLFDFFKGSEFKMLGPGPN